MSAALSGFWLLVGTLGLFFGVANDVFHVPFAVLLYPAALFVLAMRSASPFRLGWLTGIPGAALSLFWIAVAAHLYGGFPWLLAAPCSVLLGMYVALWGGIFAWLMAHCRAFPVWRRCLAAGLLWYVLEWCRGWFGSGFPWLGLSSGLAAWPLWMQPLSVLGAYGYSGLLAALACLFCEALGLSHGAEPEIGRGRAALAAALGILLLLFGFGRWRMDRVAAELAAEGEPVVVSLIQGNVRQDLKWTRDYQWNTLQKYKALSAEAVKRGTSVSGRAELRDAAVAALGRPFGASGGDTSLGGVPELLIWPETSMPFIYGRSPWDAALRAFARELRVLLVFGSLGTRGMEQAPVLYNRASLIDAAGRDAGAYDKEHLVPFGEYLPPVLDWKLFEPLLQGLGGFAPGGQGPLFELKAEGRPAVLTGMLICYEAIFPELARQRTADGAQLLANISNDAWYDRTAAPVQHLQLAAMRAVEQGRYLARATNTGISAFIDPLGGIHMPDAPDRALFTDTWLTGKVLALSRHTPYFYVHPWLPVLALALLAALWRGTLRKRRF